VVDGRDHVGIPRVSSITRGEIRTGLDEPARGANAVYRGPGRDGAVVTWLAAADERT